MREISVHQLILYNCIFVFKNESKKDTSICITIITIICIIYVICITIKQFLTSYLKNFPFRSLI